MRKPESEDQARLWYEHEMGVLMERASDVCDSVQRADLFANSEDELAARVWDLLRIAIEAGRCKAFIEAHQG